MRCVIKSALAVKIEGSSQYRFAKLRQYPQSVMGNWFWKNDTKYNLDEHLNVARFINITCETNVDLDAVTKLHGQFLNKSFPEYRSPWYLTLIENVPQPIDQVCKEIRTYIFEL